MYQNHDNYIKQRKEHTKNDESTMDVRICEKFSLTIPEAAAYFGIGEKKLRSMIADYSHLGLFLQIGVKHTVKREKFEAFLNEAYTI